MNQNNNIQQKKDNTLKTILIVIGVILGLALIGILGFFFLVYVVFDQSLEIFNDAKEEVLQNYNSSSNGNENTKPGEEHNPVNPEIINEYSNIDKITFEELKELITKKRSFVIVISQTYCGHCIDYKPKYNEVLKENNITGLELDLLTLKETDYDEFNSLLTVKGTPTTFIYIDGVVQKEFLEGSISKDKLTTYLKKYGFIK